MAKKDKKKGFFGGLFGKKESESGAEAAYDGDAGHTIVPDYAGGDDEAGFDPGVTMAPEYSAPGAGAAPGGARDPFDFDAPEPGGPGGFGPEPGELTMAPGYAPGGKPDPFGMPPGGLGELDAGELTMAPGYAGAAPSGAPGAPGSPAASANPFASTGADGFDFEAGERTMAPEYSGGPALSAPAGGDFDFEAGERTMAPEYAGPGAPSLERPNLGGPGFGAPPPSPASPALRDPFADPPEGLAGGSPDPFADSEISFDEPELTLPPSYGAGAPVGAPPPLGGPVTGPELDPFNFDMPELGGPAPDTRAAEAAALGGIDPTDPFGPPLLDDPGPATPAPALDLDEFRAERTVVDLDSDIDQLDQIRSDTEELQIDDLEPLRSSSPELAPVPALGVATPPPPVPGAPPAPLAAAPAAPRPRPLFGARREEAGSTVYAQPAGEVQLDPSGVVFAPAVAGVTWTQVPAGFAVLSDGSVLGRGRVAGGELRVAAPTDGEAARVGPFPAGVAIDRATGAVLAPAEQVDALPWRPARAFRREDGALAFLLPAGAAFEEDGGVTLPAPAAAGPAGVEPHPVHGAVTARVAYLGLVEWQYADGWTRLELPEEAELEGELLVLPRPDAAHAPAPPLLATERRAGGRAALHLPAGARREADGVWFGPVVSAAPGGEDEALQAALARRDAPVVDEREYLGIRDQLLADGWIRLELPEVAEVQDGRVVLPARVEALAEPALLAELDRLADGRLAFALPEGAEPLGRFVLIPPAGEVPTPPSPTPAAAPRALDPSEPRRPEPPAAIEPPAVEPRAPEPPKKKLSALERFRSKRRNDDDVMSFDGVLSESEPGASASAPPADAPGEPAADASATDDELAIAAPSGAGDELASPGEEPPSAGEDGVSADAASEPEAAEEAEAAPDADADGEAAPEVEAPSSEGEASAEEPAGEAAEPAPKRKSTRRRSGRNKKKKATGEDA